MIAKCLHHGGLDPTIVIGGRLDAMGSSARLGAGEFMVAEADESDGSFMLLAPTVAVITNIDPEHMTHWGSEKALIDGFFEFANKVPFFGFSVLCIDHPTVRTILPWLRRKIVTYGQAVDADVRATNLSFNGLKTQFDVEHKGTTLGTIQMAMPGEHNVSNALAAIAISLMLDIEFSAIEAGLNGFTGVDRRFSVRGEIATDDAAPITIIDDYGHHPVEIEATLKGTREAWPNRRIIAVFQPHRYSRVIELHADFCQCFSHADHVVVCPIYAAGEKPIEGIHHMRLAQGIRKQGHRNVHAVETLNDAIDHLDEIAQPGDVIITLGAGNVNQICTGLLERHNELP